MSIPGTALDESAPPTATAPDVRRRIGGLALFAALYTYALIVFGGIVRITGSGMGCGPDWPRCNGEWIPTFTLETFIEYMHRLLAAGIGIVVLIVLGYALLRRHSEGVSGRGGVTRPLALAAVLLVAQALLGAVTVWLELPTEVTVAHFATAMIFLALLIIAAVRGGVFGNDRSRHSDSKAWTLAAATTGLGFVVVVLGAFTANTPGAPPACMGFPLCSGELLPPRGALPAEIHWAHRLAAFALLALAVGAAWDARRATVSSRVRAVATATALLLAAQIAVAAALVLLRLPQSLQALHLAVGAAVWFALVVWAALARRDARSIA